MPGDALQVIFGNNLRVARLNAGLTQEELATRVGLDKSYVGMLERGEKSPSLETIGNLAVCLSVPPDVFFLNADGGDEERSVKRVILAVRQLEVQGRLAVVEKIADLVEQVAKVT